MLIRWRHLVALTLAVIIAAFLIGWSGVIGIRASSGHWKITDVFLHWVMRSSVRTSALGTQVPPFTPGMLPAAAGHFEMACAICHGSPARPRPESVARMLPAPPDLGPVIPTWSDAELFQIVQHGVRYTGMPAWPVQTRDDEAWAMVAFLRAYPAMDAAAYHDFAGQRTSSSDRFAQIIDRCNGCHLPDRLSGDSIAPMIHGQKVDYISQALEAYVTGARPSGMMTVALENTTKEDRERLARHFAAQTTKMVTNHADAEIFARGEKLAVNGDPSRGIPACVSCHDGDGLNSGYPRLSGQPQAYIAAQLRLFVKKNRGGGPYAAIMTRAASRLEPADIQALSMYFTTRRETSK